MKKRKAIITWPLGLLSIFLIMGLPIPGEAATDILKTSALLEENGDSPSTVMPEGLRQAVLSRLQAIESDPDTAKAYRARNPVQRLSIRFNAKGINVKPQKNQGTWQWGMGLKAFGYGEDLRQVPAPVMRSEGNRIIYERGSLSEWYVNDARGLEQGFTISAPPQGKNGDSLEPLVLAMAFSGDLDPVWRKEGEAIAFSDSKGRTVLRYENLYAFDVNSRRLPARLALDEGTLSILVDDTEAAYPITIDPLLFTETKVTALDAAAADYFGVSVSISGDTALIGAYGDNAAGFFSGSAYVFVRSGTSWSQEAKLVASDAAGG